MPPRPRFAGQREQPVADPRYLPPAGRACPSSPASSAGGSAVPRAPPGSASSTSPSAGSALPTSASPAAIISTGPPAAARTQPNATVPAASRSPRGTRPPARPRAAVRPGSPPPVPAGPRTARGARYLGDPVGRASGRHHGGNCHITYTHRQTGGSRNQDSSDARQRGTTISALNVGVMEPLMRTARSPSRGRRPTAQRTLLAPPAGSGRARHRAARHRRGRGDRRTAGAALSTASQAAIEARAVIAGKAARPDDRACGLAGRRHHRPVQRGRDRHGERRLGRGRLVGLDRDRLHRRGAPARNPLVAGAAPGHADRLRAVRGRLRRRFADRLLAVQLAERHPRAALRRRPVDPPADPFLGAAAAVGRGRPERQRRGIRPRTTSGSSASTPGPTPPITTAAGGRRCGCPAVPDEVSAVSADDIWALHANVAWNWNGAKWAASRIPKRGQEPARALRRPDRHRAGWRLGVA